MTARNEGYSRGSTWCSLAKQNSKADERRCQKLVKKYEMMTGIEETEQGLAIHIKTKAEERKLEEKG